MSGFGGTHRQLNGHQDHVRVPQGGAQGVGEAAGVFVQLALVHQAFVALVHEFDRVFDREDVFAAGVIDVIQQCRQGGGLAGSVQHHRRQVQQFNAGNRAAKGPQAGGIAAFLAVDVHAEACNALEAVGAVQFPGLLQRLALAVVQHREDQLVAVLLGQGSVRHSPLKRVHVLSLVLQRLLAASS